jgi:uncharacterized protein (DUF885 family)
VEAIPPFQAAAATHYVTGTPDGKRPGRVVVATSNFAERSLIDDEAVAYHEGVPLVAPIPPVPNKPKIPSRQAL